MQVDEAGPGWTDWSEAGPTGVRQDETERSWTKRNQAGPSATKRNQAGPSATKRDEAEPSWTKRNQAQPSLDESTVNGSPPAQLALILFSIDVPTSPALNFGFTRCLLRLFHSTSSLASNSSTASSTLRTNFLTRSTDKLPHSRPTAQLRK